MKQTEVIAAVAKLDKEFDAIQKAKDSLDKREKRYYKKSIELEKHCNHRYANGKSACKGSFLCNICEICGWTDL